MSWSLSLFITWPHDRFLLGWSYLPPDEDYYYNTFELYLTFISLQFNWD
jgi:hypothetical protein